ncbi:hypothetical protein ACQ4M3_40065 [Leptolyngbya sp. AN03gr2]|uniref:hypothetical protein n=1 Tax=unclassified Leptolyngbya TaxID=2650499 RepID=UPI003D31E0A4
MEFLFALIMVSSGLWCFVARDEAWKAQELRNRREGQVSERTEEWEMAQMVRGVAQIGVGLIFAGGGIGVRYQENTRPVVPKICASIVRITVVDNDKRGIVRDIETGCSAARRKDYRSALSNFQRADASIRSTPPADSSADRRK